LGILSKLSSVEWASVVAKSDLSGDLDPRGVRFLCKNCRENFVEVYDFSGIPELGGLRFLFRKFVERLAMNLGGSHEFIDAYGLGIIKMHEGTIAVMRVQHQFLDKLRTLHRTVVRARSAKKQIVTNQVNA